MLVLSILYHFLCSHSTYSLRRWSAMEACANTALSLDASFMCKQSKTSAIFTLFYNNIILSVAGVRQPKISSYLIPSKISIMHCQSQFLSFAYIYDDLMTLLVRTTEQNRTTEQQHSRHIGSFVYCYFYLYCFGRVSRYNRGGKSLFA